MMSYSQAHTHTQMTIQGITPKHILCFFGTLFLGVAIIVGILTLRSWPKIVDEPVKINVTPSKTTP